MTLLQAREQAELKSAPQLREALSVSREEGPELIAKRFHLTIIEENDGKAVVKPIDENGVEVTCRIGKRGSTSLDRAALLCAFVCQFAADSSA
jgi:hypothetical protein